MAKMKYDADSWTISVQGANNAVLDYKAPSVGAYTKTSDTAFTGLLAFEQQIADAFNLYREYEQIEADKMLTVGQHIATDDTIQATILQNRGQA